MSRDGVRVEPADLLAKAGELGTEPEDSLLPPVPPCGLSFVVNASAVVAMNVATLKSFLASGNAEAVRKASLADAELSAKRRDIKVSELEGRERRPVCALELVRDPDFLARPATVPTSFHLS